MITIKIQCVCGQKFAFDVEPINGRMPASIACPVCGADGTEAANVIIARNQPAPAPAAVAAPIPAAAAPAPALAGGLQLRRSASDAAVAEAPTLATASATATATAPAPAAAPRRPMLPGQVGRDQAQVEARAKILWGDPQEEVVKYLMAQGFSIPEARATVAELFKERAKTIRKNGIKKIGIGIVFMCIPVATLIFFLSIGILPVKILAITIIVGIYGFYLVIKGIIMTIAPKSEPGEVE